MRDGFVLKGELFEEVVRNFLVENVLVGVMMCFWFKKREKNYELII